MDEEDLIKKSDLAKALGFKASDKNVLLDAIGHITGITKLNKVWNRVKNFESVEVINAFLAEQNIHIEINPNDLKKIPGKGGFITVSNHPFGALDGIILIKLLAEQRADFKVQANFLLQKLSSLNSFFIPVNPLESHKSAASSVSGIKASLQHVQQGGGLGLFPAGEVSSFQLQSKRVTDRKWQPSSIKLVKKAGVSVLPIYFEGRNSNVFQILGLFHPLLRTAVLPSELFKKENQTIKVRIGQPILPKEIAQFESADLLGKYLRARTYSLGSKNKVKNLFLQRLKPLIAQEVEPIAPAADPEQIHAEFEKLESNGKMLFQTGNFKLFLGEYGQIPTIFGEIGRLREITYRAVGEGTNRSTDIDEFDEWYRHLILYDFNQKHIVGAYRIGFGKDIMGLYGSNGFYTATLFKYKPKFKSILAQCIELGRSFIVPQYQTKPLPLFILWQGILEIIKSNPEYRHVIGPVSISNHFSNLSKSLIVNFLSHNFYHTNLGPLVKPRKRFKPKIDVDSGQSLLEYTKEDIKKIDQLIGDIEVSGQKVPVLIKKYMKQNAKILGFNVDPKFNHALDALMIMDISDIPQETQILLGK